MKNRKKAYHGNKDQNGMKQSFESPTDSGKKEISSVSASCNRKIAKHFAAGSGGNAAGTILKIDLDGLPDGAFADISWLSPYGNMFKI